MIFLYYRYITVIKYSVVNIICRKVVLCSQGGIVPAKSILRKWYLMKKVFVYLMY